MWDWFVWLWSQSWGQALVFIAGVVVLSYALDVARGGKSAWRSTRDLRHRWRAKRRGVRMELWQRRTGRHDGWS